MLLVLLHGGGGGGIVGVSLLVIEFFLCKQAQFVLCIWDQFVGVDCFLSMPSVLLFWGCSLFF